MANARTVMKMPVWAKRFMIVGWEASKKKWKRAQTEAAVGAWLAKTTDEEASEVIKAIVDDDNMPIAAQNGICYSYRWEKRRVGIKGRTVKKNVMMINPQGIVLNQSASFLTTPPPTPEMIQAMAEDAYQIANAD